MCFEGKWLQNRLRVDKSESRSLLAVDIQGHQRGFCIRRSMSSSSSLSFKCALRESGCRIGYESTKASRDHFWRSISRDTNVVSALGVRSLLHRVFPSNVLWGKVVAESVTSRQKRVEITFGGRHPEAPTWRFLHCPLKADNPLHEASPPLIAEHGWIQRRRHEKILQHWPSWFKRRFTQKL